MVNITYSTASRSALLSARLRSLLIRLVTRWFVRSPVNGHAMQQGIGKQNRFGVHARVGQAHPCLFFMHYEEDEMFSGSSVLSVPHMSYISRCSRDCADEVHVLHWLRSSRNSKLRHNVSGKYFSANLKFKLPVFSMATFSSCSAVLSKPSAHIRSAVPCNCSS